MNLEIKNKAKELTQGIRLNLFLPVFVIMLISSLLDALYIGLLVIFLFDYMAQIYIYNFVKTGNRQFSDLFNEYKDIDNLVTLVKANFGMVIINIVFILLIMIGNILITALGNFLFIIMNIIGLIGFYLISYFFFAIPYIIKDSNYKINIKDSFTLSNNMMKGNKFRLFCFQLSFIGHFLLVGLTFGIYLIWFSAYYRTSLVLFYEQIKKEYLNRAHDDLSNQIRDEEENVEEDINNINSFDFETPDEVLHKEDNEDDDVIFIELKDDDIIKPDDD